MGLAGAPADRLALFRRDLEAVVVAIRASGATPVLITHTNRFIGLSAKETSRERRHLVNLMVKYYPRASETVLIAMDSAANQVIRDLARTHGVAVIETQGKIPHGDRYFADYAHFTDQGADAMARLIARYLIEASPERCRRRARAHPDGSPDHRPRRERTPADHGGVLPANLDSGGDDRVGRLGSRSGGRHEPGRSGGRPAHLARPAGWPGPWLCHDHSDPPLGRVE